MLSPQFCCNLPIASCMSLYHDLAQYLESQNPQGRVDPPFLCAPITGVDHVARLFQPR